MWLQYCNSISTGTLPKRAMPATMSPNVRAERPCLAWNLDEISSSKMPNDRADPMLNIIITDAPKHITYLSFSISACNTCCSTVHTYLYSQPTTGLDTKSGTPHAGATVLIRTST